MPARCGQLLVDGAHGNVASSGRPVTGSWWPVRPYDGLLWCPLPVDLLGRMSANTVDGGRSMRSVSGIGRLALIFYYLILFLKKIYV